LTPAYHQPACGAMIVSTHRPYFAPFPGFFRKAQRSDILIILDQVQFPRGTTWITRNRFKNDQGTLWLTIPVWKKGLGLQNITDVRICREGRWASKHLNSLKHAYGNAPFFSEHLQFVERLFATAFDKIIDLNMAVIRHLMLHLGLATEVRLLSELNINVRGDALPVEICRTFAASAYLAEDPAAKYLNRRLFEKAGIELRYHQPRSIIYPQLWGDFISDLSAFDLLFNCGPKARDLLLKPHTDIPD